MHHGVTPQEPRANDQLFRWLIVAAVASTLTLGSTFGAASLLAIHGGSGAGWVSPQAHATAQLFGFVFLFVVGVAVHAMPRFLGVPLAKARLARAVLPLMGSALVLRIVAQFLPASRTAVILLLLAGIAGTAAVAAFLLVLRATRASSRLGAEALNDLLAAGTAFWALAAVLLVVGAVDALLANDPYRALLWNPPAYAAALYGGSLLWVFGMFVRIGPVFVGVTRPTERSARSLFALTLVTALLLTAGAIIEGPVGRGEWGWITALGEVSFLVTAAFSAFALRIFHPPREPERKMDPPFVWAVRGSFLALIFSGVAFAFDALLRFQGSRANHLVVDSGRHLLAIGFLLLLIFAFATRILPIFAGVKPVWPETRGLAFSLVGLGLLLRLGEVAAAFGAYRALLLSAVSGLVTLVGVVVLSVIVIRTVLPPRMRPVIVIGSIRAETNILEMIETHPRTLHVLVRNGFESLQFPAVRRTVARSITVEQAAQVQQIPLEQLLNELRAAAANQ